METPPDERPGHDPARYPGVSGAEEPIRGIAGASVRVEATDAFERAPSGQHRLRQIARHGLGGRTVTEPDLLLGQFRDPEVLDVRHADVVLGVLVEVLHLRCELVRVPEVVRVEEGYERTRGCIEA